MARYLILPLILLLALAGLLAYVGNDPWVNITLLANEADSIAKQSVGISLQAAILGLVLITASIIILWSLGVWLWRLPQRMKTGFGRQRHQNGLDALEDALLAGEAGDGERARKKARRARELLDRPALSELVSAKAAEAAGEMDEASTHYTNLLEDEKTKSVGLRGLARMAADKGDHHTAIEMAQSAYSSGKAPAWAFDILFKSQVAQNDWGGALESLGLAEKRKHIDKASAQRRKAVLLSASAAHFEKTGAFDLALSTALKATETSTGFAPANALAARLLSKSGQSKKAANLLEKAWSKNPHPALALSYGDLFTDESEKTRTKKINAFIKTNPDHRESQIFIAQEALSAGNAVECLQALNPILSSEDPSVRLCLLASAAEEKLGNPIDARTWQIRATSAPVEADWSDLDPDGPAFDYTQTDWQRLVMSYGETGELIHPRHEMYKRRRAVISEIAPTQTSEPVEPPRPDDPGIPEAALDDADLSQRLENLLDDKP
ncbi:MAG: heme biosynthesis protein HemY [Robiginitomaculum sp.]|nr:MAG: heme biosynthesis protein HemY [Robiginitomaculum sp.]